MGGAVSCVVCADVHVRNKRASLANQQISIVPQKQRKDGERRRSSMSPYSNLSKRGSIDNSKRASIKDGPTRNSRKSVDDSPLKTPASLSSALTSFAMPSLTPAVTPTTLAPTPVGSNEGCAMPLKTRTAGLTKLPKKNKKGGWCGCSDDAVKQDRDSSVKFADLPREKIGFEGIGDIDIASYKGITSSYDYSRYSVGGPSYGSSTDYSGLSSYTYDIPNHFADIGKTISNAAQASEEKHKNEPSYMALMQQSSALAKENSELSSNSVVSSEYTGNTDDMSNLRPTEVAKENASVAAANAANVAQLNLQKANSMPTGSGPTMSTHKLNYRMLTVDEGSLVDFSKKDGENKSTKTQADSNEQEENRGIFSWMFGSTTGSEKKSTAGKKSTDSKDGGKLDNDDTSSNSTSSIDYPQESTNPYHLANDQQSYGYPTTEYGLSPVGMRYPGSNNYGYGGYEGGIFAVSSPYGTKTAHAIEAQQILQQQQRLIYQHQLMQDEHELMQAQEMMAIQAAQQQQQAMLQAEQHDSDHYTYNQPSGFGFS